MENGRLPEGGARAREELLSELERLTGRHFQTREDVQNFVAAVEAEKSAKQARSAARWRMLKHSTLLALLVLAAMQFYLLDTLVQVLSLRELTVFVPVTARDLRSVLTLVSGLG